MKSTVLQPELSIVRAEGDCKATATLRPLSSFACSVSVECISCNHNCEVTLDTSDLASATTDSATAILEQRVASDLENTCDKDR